MLIACKTPVTPAAANHLFAAAAAGPWAGRIAYSEAPHASIDFNHDPHSAIVDGSQTRGIGARLVNVFVWFDNEWGFANRMLDLVRRWSALCSESA
jgi:glyceraldehyde 3-phosphate dehydrogenase/D-erythrose 4-phosphate dehydrogenase